MNLRPSSHRARRVPARLRVFRVSLTTLPIPVDDPAVVDEASLADPWVTIVWNDPVNLMSYVSYVFRSYFGYSQAAAERLMMQVHEEGRAVVATGNREAMEVDVQAMHSFGLWATLQRSGQ
jgi:ATP-dependent Clp protease adaptor protein ClpS